MRMFFGETSWRMSSGPPAVAHRHGHGPLRLVLADDVAIQVGDDFPRGQVAHASSSTTRCSLV